MRRKKYLNNKDLLKEIHKSKNSFSSYVDEDRDHQYDIILPSLERVTYVQLHRPNVIVPIGWANGLMKKLYCKANR